MSENGRSDIGRSGWLLVTASVGTDGSLRVRVWRELRRLGAVYLHSGVCVLPARSRVVAQVTRLNRRVVACAGQMRVLRIQLLDRVQREWVEGEQRRERDVEYAEVVERSSEFLAEIDRELACGRASYTEVEESETDLVDRRF